MFSKNKDWFYKDSYYHQWHRVILRGGSDIYPHQVMIPLTAMNLDSKHDWTDVSQVRIIRSDTRYAAFKDTGTWTHNLPDEVYETMTRHLGNEKADFLVHADILPLINWDIFNRHNNAGCYLDVCQKNLNWIFSHTQVTENETSSVFPQRDQFLELIKRDRHSADQELGGLLYETDAKTLVFFANYDTINHLVTVEINYAEEGQEHISRFARRYSANWAEEILSFLVKMHSAGKIEFEVLAALKHIINSAEVNLTALKTQPSFVEAN